MTAKEETNPKSTELSDEILENVSGGTDFPLCPPQTNSEDIVLNQPRHTGTGGSC